MKNYCALLAKLDVNIAVQRIQVASLDVQYYNAQIKNISVSNPAKIQHFNLHSSWNSAAK